jgi:amino acid permease
MKPETFVGTTGILIATTIGAGIFALPHLFLQAGWAAGLGTLGVLGALVFVAHRLYASAASREGGDDHLAGMAGRTLGPWGNAMSFIAVFGGLALSLVVYIILSANFARLFAADVNGDMAMAAFWLAGSLPLVVRMRFIGAASVFGTLVMAVLIVGLWLAAPTSGGVGTVPLVPGKALVPFGGVLFALAAWTAIPAMMTSAGGRRPVHELSGPLAVGTVVVVALYALFAFAILGSGWTVTPDTISGIPEATRSVALALGVLGLFALWTSYVPIALELRDSLAGTLGSKGAATAAVAVLPIALVGIGLRDFVSVIGLAGGVFLSLQYALIMAVSRKVLRLHGLARVATDIITLAFLAAALYELYVFVLH